MDFPIYLKKTDFRKQKSRFALEKVESTGRWGRALTWLEEPILWIFQDKLQMQSFLTYNQLMYLIKKFFKIQIYAIFSNFHWLFKNFVNTIWWQ